MGLNELKGGVSKNLKIWFVYRWKGMVRSLRIRRETLHQKY